MRALSDEAKDRLHRDLVKLGDMMGDGLHLEPDGKWISTEYRRICRALGYTAPRRNRTDAINERMAERVKEVNCQLCQGELKQSRSGSMKAICKRCGTKWRLLK